MSICLLPGTMHSMRRQKVFEKLFPNRKSKENPVKLPKVDPTPPPGSSAITAANIQDSSPRYTVKIEVNQTGYSSRNLKYKGTLRIYENKALAYFTSANGPDADVILDKLEKDARDWVAFIKRNLNCEAL